MSLLNCHAEHVTQHPITRHTAQRRSINIPMDSATTLRFAQNDEEGEWSTPLSHPTHVTLHAVAGSGIHLNIPMDSALRRKQLKHEPRFLINTKGTI
jgi:hypothetical protein